MTEFEIKNSGHPNHAEWLQATDSGAEIIGRLVVAAATACNRLSPGGSAQHKDLIQLILGHVELEKNAVLKIVQSGAEQSEKQRQMAACLMRGKEYFDSILLQAADLNRPQ